MEKKNLIVFDIDGTLTQSVAIHQLAFIQALKNMSVTQIDTNFKAYKHHTDSYIAKEIYETDKQVHFSEAQVNEFEKHLYNLICSQHIEEISGAKRMVEFLENETDYGVCYATGSLRTPAEYKLNSIGVAYAKNQLTASNTILDREGIVQQAINKAQAFYNVDQFNQIVSVGDGLWDLHTARHLDLGFIGIGGNKDVLLEHGARHYYPDFKELIGARFATFNFALAQIKE